MKYYACLMTFILLPISMVMAQNRFEASVVDSSTGNPVIGANVLVEGTNLGGTTNMNGQVTVTGIPNGRQTIVFSSVGYKTYRIHIVLPMPASSRIMQVRLVQSNVELQGVTVTTTRTSYHLNDSPDRVEVKGEEDIGETAIDHPSDISEIFLESTGIQVLQTSAVSNYVSVKLQGLDGSYTQILKDGFPLYGGLSSDLSITQIPPLDLSRVEIIKGPSSSLYGGGAIAGLINLISKPPSRKGEFNVLLNGNTSNGIDAGVYYSKQTDNLGTTILFNGNMNSEYDGDHTGFSDIPESQSFTFNPKLFYDFDDGTKLTVGISTTYDNMVGGDMTAIKDGPSSLHPYLERSKSSRTYSQLELNSVVGGGTSLTLKNSVGYFLLNSSLESDQFRGHQWTSYTELTFQSLVGDNTLTGGLNLITDSFAEDPSYSGMNRSYGHWTTGLFGQDDWRIIPPLTFEAGLRIDKPNDFAAQVLPRIAGIYRVTEKLGLRASFGLGYKVPSIFSDQSDPNSIYSIVPISSDTRVEKSIGGEFDINYAGLTFGDFSLSIDQAFFYTRVNSPLGLIRLGSPLSEPVRYALENSDGYLFSKGAETDLKLDLGDMEVFIGYTYVDAREDFSNYSGGLYLTPPTKFVTDIVYDIEKFGEAGIEIRYMGPQLLHDGTTSPSFWVSDLLFEKRLSDFTFFAAIENWLNYKQINYTPIYTGGITSPQFNDVWAPIEGRVVNVGFKIQI